MLVSSLSFRPASLLALKARYKPIFELYFWFGTLVFGRSPAAFHAASIVLHIVNGWLVLALAVRLGMRPAFAFAAAMLFVVQPAYVAAVAWVGAVAEALVVLFGCSSVLALLAFRRRGSTRWLAAAIVLYTTSLLTHESAVAFLPILVLADVAFARRSVRELLTVHAPFLVVTGVYLAFTFAANTADYRQTEMQYTFGGHVFRHILDYAIALYVDKPTAVSYALTGAVLAAVLAFGNARARFAIAWLVFGALPFAPFEVGVLSRYAYLPSIGLALLLAEGLAVLHRSLAHRRPRPAGPIVAVLALFVGVRFSHFARDGVKDSWNAAERYRTFLTDLGRENPSPPDGTVVYITPERNSMMERRFVEAAIQWEFRNPTLRVEVR